MKRLTYKALFGVAVMIGICYFFMEEKSTIESLTFENIEALASGENESLFRCYGSGSIDCHGHKVEMKISGLSLD